MPKLKGCMDTPYWKPAQELLSETDTRHAALRGVMQARPSLAVASCAGEQQELAEALDQQLVVALRYLACCAPGVDRTRFRVSSAWKASYPLKHRAERAVGGYVSRGAFVAMALAIGCKVKDAQGVQCAFLYLDLPRDCTGCKGLAAVPPISCTDDLFCTACLDNPFLCPLMPGTFWTWVVRRRRHDNPRGDFIADTQEEWAAGRNPDATLSERAWSNAVAADEYRKLARTWCRETGWQPDGRYRGPEAFIESEHGDMS